jgi:hypothetical protein
MTAVLWIVLALLALDAAFIGGLLVGVMPSPFSTAMIPEVAPLLVLAGVLAALMAFIVNLRRGRSEDILEAAGDLLEKAHDALSPNGGALTNHRHAWLSAARLVATAERLSGHIVEPSHKTIFEEKRQYWRSRIYDLICPCPPEGLPSSFYADRPEHMIAYSGRVRDPLSEKSLAVLYRFIKWPEGTQDPIGQEPRFSDAEIEHMRTFGPRGLGQLMTDVRARERRTSENEA